MDCPQTFRGEAIRRSPTDLKNLFCLLSFAPNGEEACLFLLRTDRRRNAGPTEAGSSHLYANTNTFHPHHI